MPALDATTTAVFASVGISPSSIYGIFQSLIGVAVSFGMWLIQVGWPFWLGLAFILFLYGIATHYRLFGMGGRR